MTETQFTVLIADDEATIRNGLCEIIPWDLYHAQVVEAAPDGITALSAIRRLRPDLVILDIKMPGMDGLDVVRCAREEGIDSRFLILSGYNDFPLAQRAIRYGVNAYFLKPLKVNEFKDELSRQFADILASRGPKAQPANMDALLETSRLFLLNQLIRNELRSQDELERRSSMLRTSLDLHAPCAIVVITAPGCDPEDMPAVLRKAEAQFLRQYRGRPGEIWVYAEQYVVLLCQEEAREEELAVLRHTLEELHQLTGLRMAAGIGLSVPSPIHAAQSFSSALRALSYDLYQLPGNVYDPGVICTRMPSANLPDPSFYDRLIEAMENGHEAMVAQVCHDWMQALFYVPTPPPDYLRGKCLSLVSGVCDRFNATHPDEGPFAPPQMDEVRSARTVSELEQWLTLRLTDYHLQYRNARRKADPLVEAAKAYIQRHLSENIKAGDVAAEVNLSASYFTIYFKAKAGCNFRDYVLSEKMKYARELLQQGMNVSEIAYAIGYTDYRSFSRAFKNVTGHTPSDYMNV